MCGNIIKCIISLLKGSDNDIKEASLRLMKLKVVDYVIELIKSAGNDYIIYQHIQQGIFHTFYLLSILRGRTCT